MLKTTTKTIYPELVDNLVANSLEFVNKYTDYLSSIGSIPAPTSSSNSKNVTQLQPNPNTKGIESAANSYSAGDLQNQMKIALNFQKALRSNDPITSLKAFFIDLNDKMCDNLNNDFIFYWYKKFQTCFTDIQDVFKDKSDVYLNDISDSIGTIANFACKYTDNVSPLTDLTNNDNAPSQIPITIVNKLSKNTVNLHNKLNNLTSLIQKNNLINIQKVQSGQYSLSYLQADTTVSHGANLITDLKFYQDFYNYLPVLVDKLSTIFNKTLSFITYFSNINDKSGFNSRDLDKNLQVISNINYTSNVEDVKFKLDILQKPIKPSLGAKTIKETLGVNTVRTESTPSTASVNNKFLGKDTKPTTLTPISNSVIAQEREKAAASEIKQPNKDIVNLNAQVQRLGLTPPPSSTNKSTQKDLTLTVNNKEAVTKKPDNNTSGKLPSADIGSIPEIAALASNTSNFSNTDPQAALSNLESLNSIYCNFKLPEINQGDLKNLTSGDVTINEKQLVNMLLGLVPKVTLPKLDDYTQAMKQLIESLDPEKIWKSFYSKVFECKNKKDY